MKKKIFSILFAVALVLSFILATAVPAGAATTFTLAGSTIEVTSLAEPYATQTEEAFIAEPHTTVVDGVAFDAQTCSQVVIEGTVSALDLGDGWPNTAYVEIGLRPEATMDARNAGVYLIAFNVAGGGTRIHLQDYTGMGFAAGVINITEGSDYRYKIKLEPSGDIGGIATLEVWVGAELKGTVSGFEYGYESDWRERTTPDGDPALLKNEDFSDAYLFYSIIAECRGAGSITYSATVGDITVDDTLYVGAGQQFATIQAAIDFANPGDTINVAAGTYNEQVEISQSLTLQGAGDTTIIQPSGPELTATASIPWIGSSTKLMSAIVSVETTGDEVTIRDLKIDGSLITSKSTLWVGGLVYLETSGKVEGVTVIGNPALPDRTAGIFAAAVTQTSLVEVTGCNVIGYNRAGIYALGAEFTADYHHNEINGPGSISTGVPNGMFFLEGANGSATYNTVTDLFYTGEEYRSTGIGTYNAGTDVTFAYNTISNVQNAFALSTGTSGTIVEYNETYNCHTGVRIEADATNSVIQYNDIHDNDFAIRCGPGMGDGNEAHYNNFVNNPGLEWTNVGEGFTYEGAVCNVHETFILDATCNWWDDVSGPYQATTNPTASGDEVSDNVCYSPWLGQSKDAPHPWVFYVDDVGPDPDAGYIQTAINAATSGDTINVAAGTYNEQVVIDKQLTLNGANAGVNAVTGTRGSESIIDGGDTTAVTISADDVVVDGFTLDGGITLDDRANPVSGGAISNNIITGADSSVEPIKAQNGIRVGFDLDGLGVDGVTIENNTIFNNLEAGIEFSNAKEEVPYGGDGIQRISNITISGNEIKDNGASGISTYGPGPNTIINNIISDNVGAGMNLKFDDGDVVTGNTITDNTGPGITLKQATNTTVEYNNVSDHRGIEGGNIWKGSGIHIFFSSEDNTIRYNDISDNNYGIFIRSKEVDGELLQPSDNSINFNNIYGNTYGIFNALVDPPAPVDATNNWWGDASGPDHADNPHGTGQGGDVVSDNVDFMPWYATATTSPTTQNVSVDHPDTSIIAYSDTIQGGIDAALSGDTINVVAGTYNERITIEKPLTLRGATWNVNKNGYEVPVNYAWDTSVESIINNPAPAPTGVVSVVLIQDTSDVTFEGFVVQSLNAPQGSENDMLVTVWAKPMTMNNINIRNCVIGPNTNVEDQDGTAGRMGLYLATPTYPTDGEGITNSTFSGNKIFDCLGNGNNVFVWGAAKSYSSPARADYTGTVIEDNEICGSHRSGIEIAGGVKNLVIQNNDIYGNSGSPGDASILKYGTGIVVIRMGSDKANPLAWGADNLLIADNNIYNNEKNGVYLGPINTNHSIIGNTFYGNGWDAIRVDLTEQYHGGTYDVTNVASGIAANFNNIYDNVGYGVQVIGTPTNGFVLDATNNWWGDASGPTYATNLLGIGDTVSDNVDYDPWIGAPVKDSKRQTVTNDTVDATGETDTGVVVTGTATVTVAKYTSNPGTGFGGDTGKYIDVHIDDPSGVTEIEIRVYYTDAEITGLVESSLRLRWWDGTRWVACSDSGVNTTDILVPPPAGAPYSGYMWAVISDNTTPSLGDLTGTPFGSGGAAVAVGGFIPVGCYLEIDMLGEITMVEMDCCRNTTAEDCQAFDEEQVHLLELQEETLVLCGDCEGCDCYPRIIVMSLSEETPELPEGMAIVGDIYDFTGYKDTRRQIACQLATYFNPAASVLLNYDTALLPEGAFNPVIGFYSHDLGQWIILPPDTGRVAEVGVATGLAEYFASPFAVLVNVPPPATPEPPPSAPEPAHFVATGLNITPAEIKVGESVTISLNVANDGEETGTYIVELKINGQTIDSQVVTLGGGQSEPVSFTLTETEAGTYEATVSGLSGAFTVLATSNWWIYLIIAAVVIILGLLALRFRRKASG